MKKIYENRLTIYKDGVVEFDRLDHDVLLESKNTIVYEDKLSCYNVIYVNPDCFMYNIHESLDKVIVHQGNYYDKNGDSKSGVKVYLHTYKDRDVALVDMKNGILEKYSWMDKESIESAFNSIEPCTD